MNDDARLAGIQLLLSAKVLKKLPRKIRIPLSILRFILARRLVWRLINRLTRKRAR